MELGTKIYELRKNANLSQEQLSQKLNVTRQTISNWELGQTTPDIIQAKELSKIFGISLDELTNNDMKDILIEKIINTEKLTTTAIKILKFLCIIFICFLIIIISMSITSVIKTKNEEVEKQAQQEAYREYMSNTQHKQFHITVNDEIYRYVVQYGPDNKTIGSLFSRLTDDNGKTDNNFDTYLDYILQSDHTDVTELIQDVKQYFKSVGGTWEEIPY